MKKRFIFTLLILLFTVSLLPVWASSNEIRVIIDGQEVNFPAQTPVIVDGRTLVPVRGVFEALGFDVDWNPDTRTAYLTSNRYNVAISIGSSVFTTNDTEHMLDVPAEIIGGSTMLPLRAVLESVGYELEWNEAARTITIASASAAPEDYIPPGYIMIGGERFSTELTMLDLSRRNLSNEDIIPLRYMTNLTELDLRNNQISDLTPLAELTNLRDLYLINNQIRDITPLTELTNLTWLVLNSNQISDITPLAGLTNLTALILTSNQISDLTPLVGLTNLRGLSLDSNQISDLTPLAGLTNLTELILTSNQISDLTPLAELTNLIQLELASNQVSDLTPLAELTNLRSLDLCVNQISDITILAELTNLTWLFLDRNQISDITPLANLPGFMPNRPGLSLLSLYENPITDWSPVEHFVRVAGRP